MTISSQNRQAGPYLGNDVATAFTFAFKVFAASDLQVVRTDAAGVESTLTLTTDYTVALNSNQDSNPGGTVTLVAGALVSGTKLTITSSITPLQATDLTNQGGFYPKVITNAMDKLTILIQQLFNSVGRQITVPISDGSVNVNLPSAGNRANKVLGFDALGGVATYPPASAVTDAANVNFLSSGAVSRTTKDKLGDVVSVKDFGAKGDGTTDDTSAIQAAINYCAADVQQGARALYIPAGEYKTTSPLSIPKQFIEIFGDGMWASVVNFGTTAGGGLTTAAIQYLRPMFRDFALRGDAGSGTALNLGNITGQVYLGEIKNVHLQSGANAMYAPLFFSMLMQNVAATSYSGHSFVVACGPGVTWNSCYAVVCGAGKAGYRLTGFINMIGCNGLNSGDWWGIFGQDITATDGYQNDFPGLGNVYFDAQLIGCNVEEYASVSTNGGGFLLHSPHYGFKFHGGKFDRFNLSTGYKAIIQARISGNISGTPIELSPAVVFAGGGTPSLGALYTNSGGVFSDENGVFTAAGITTWRDNGAGINYPLLRKLTTPDIYGDRAYFFNAISPRRISCQVMRFNELAVATVNANPDQPATDVTGYTKIKITPASISYFSRFAFNATIGAGTDYARNGELIIEAGNGNVVLWHNYAAGDGIRLKGGANLTMAEGQIVRLVRSSNYRTGGVAGWVEA